jgi:hypothetical protein
MPLPRQEVARSRILRQAGSPLLEATLGQTLDAAFEDPTLRPTELIAEKIGDEFERVDETIPPSMSGEVVFLDDDGNASDEFTSPSRTDNLVSPKEFAEKYGELGLKLDAPTPQGVVNRLVNRKKAEILRQDVFQRGPQHIGAQIAQLGVGFFGAAVDPINIASVFIPSAPVVRVGSGLSKVGARFGRGAREGVVGAAAVEPIVYGLSNQLQLDYTMADALVNVAFGGVLGGGLHVAGGAVADGIKRGFRNRDTQPEFTRGVSGDTIRGAGEVSVRQMATGQDVNVRPIFAAARAMGEGRVRTAQDIEIDATVEWVNGVIEQSRKAPKRPETLNQFIARIGGISENDLNRGDVRAILGADNARSTNVKGRPNLIQPNGKTLDDIGEILQEERFFDERPDIPAILNKIDEDFDTPVVRQGDENELLEFDAHERAVAELDRLGVRDFRLGKDKLRELIKDDIESRTIGTRPDATTATRGVEDVREEIEELGQPDLPEELIEAQLAAREAYEAGVNDNFDLEEAIELDDDLDAVLEELRNEGFNPDEDEFLMLANEAVQDAQDMVPAIETAGLCLARAS